MLDYLLGTALVLKIATQLRLFLIRRRARNKPSAVMKDAEPFLNKTGDLGVLLIHGFSSSPYELRQFGDFLSRRQISNYCPLLPGHGTASEKLTLIRWDDWLTSLQNDLKILSALCKQIVIVGNSFGGNLAFLLAHESREKPEGKKIRAIVSLAAPFKIASERKGKLLFHLVRQFKIFQRKKYPEDIQKKLMMRGPNYLDIPLSSVTQVLKTISASKKVLPLITKPVLLMQSENDNFVAAESILYLEENLRAAVVRTQWIKRSYHNLVIDRKKNVVFDEILAFIKQHVR